MIAGVSSGLSSGIVLGFLTGPFGMLLGIVLGIAVGLMVGYVLADDDDTRTRRTKELDKIIGITHGTMGAGGPITMPPEKGADDEEVQPSYGTKEQWLAEWLTPQPPDAI
jgi:hypothetical protein